MRYLLLLMTLVALGGCSTVPQVSRQAQNTAALVGELRQSVTDFQRQQRLVMFLITESLILQEQDIAKAHTRAVVDATVRRSAGDLQGFVVADALTAAADASALKAANDPALLKRVEAITGATTSSPVTDESLSATQRAALIMSEELSAETRWKEHRAFVEAVRNGVKANRDAMRKASDAAIAAK
ncbi:hypothetical protein OU994_17545 [Pseudoduganella sp. SL102]|uniref:hypothetical protein n=1 Tax=Pseudoduganella sp. SL102 TaxID=2995154 RepID=UPI00248ABFE6|nr:hypothetical protein [Pseudoduganella sp. SL102]WBS00127.1 hypothetical protein OU994_17545 [Pseudoduganella sp. SL102]